MSGVYDVFVKLSMVNAVSPVLAVISKELLGLEGSVKRLSGELSGMNRALLAVGGGLSVMAGSAVLGGMSKLIDKGNELVKLQRDMAQAGVKQTEVQDAYNKALELTAKYQNLSAAEALKMINDARGVFGDQEKAVHESDSMAGAASFLKAYEGGKHGGSEQALFAEINAAIKSGEIAGKITPEEMRSHIAELIAMKVAFGDQVKIGQYLTAQRAGGVALRNTSDEFRYGMFPALVQENGPGAGVMLMTAFNKIVAGVGNRTQSLQEMARLGLLNEDQVKYDKNGRAIGLKDADGIKNSREAAMNFGSWVMTTLKPLLDKESGGDKIREAQLISKMFPDRNAAKAITEILQQFAKLQKDAELIHRVSRDYKGYGEGSLDYQKQALATQVDNFFSILGGPMVKPATEALAGINSVLSGIAQWAGKADPATLRMIGEGIAILGAAMVGAGIAALIAAIGTGGWLVAGLIAIGGAIYEFKEPLMALIPTASQAVHAIQDLMSAIGGIPAAVANAVKGMLGIGPARDIPKTNAFGVPINDDGTPKQKFNPDGTPQVHGSLGAPYLPPGRGASHQVADVYLDGQKVGHVIERGIAMNNRTVNSASGFDGRDAWQHPEVAFG